MTDTTPGAARERSYDGGYMAAGKKAEERVIAWLRSRSDVLAVTDLRHVSAMQEADVDCRLTLRDGRTPLAEIKSDRHLGMSGHFLFEALRINHTAEPDKAVILGWSARSHATWFLLYDPVSDRVHSITSYDYRQALQKATDEQRGKTRINYVATDRIKSTVNLLIPSPFVVSMPSYRLHQLKPEEC